MTGPSSLHSSHTSPSWLRWILQRTYLGGTWKWWCQLGLRWSYTSHQSPRVPLFRSNRSNIWKKKNKNKKIKKKSTIEMKKKRTEEGQKIQGKGQSHRWKCHHCDPVGNTKNTYESDYCKVLGVPRLPPQCLLSIRYSYVSLPCFHPPSPIILTIQLYWTYPVQMSTPLSRAPYRFEMTIIWTPQRFQQGHLRSFPFWWRWLVLSWSMRLQG